MDTKELVIVRYVGRKYKGFFGDKDYVALPRYQTVKTKEPVKWQIVDNDGDTYTVANGTLAEGLIKDWIIV